MSWILGFVVLILIWNAEGQNTRQITKTTLKGVPPCAPKEGDIVTVHYTGNFKSNGAKFDSSRDRNEPFNFTLLRQEVITGWDIAVSSMIVGERARFDIPWEYAYGAGGYPPSIPPNADLVFDIELLGIEKPQQRRTGRP